MDWIKKHYDRFALLFLAVILVGSSVFLIWSVKQLPESFVDANDNPPHLDKLPPLDSAVLDAAQKSIVKPTSWDVHPSSLFVSRKYIVRDNELIDPAKGDEMLHPPVPNQWLTDNSLDLLDNNVLNEDPSGDGFTNLEKFQANCNPWDYSSHPAFVTKLRLKKFSTTPFHFKFEAYDGDTFQVNPLDLHKGSQFLKMNDLIEGTKYKIVKFDLTKVPNEKITGGETDVSKLSIQDTETGGTLVLPIGETINSPDSIGIFRYLWDNTEFQVRRGQKFSLKPEAQVEYKLIDINETEALIIDTKKEDIQIKVAHLEDSPR